jgi:hypothetical protein
VTVPAYRTSDSTDAAKKAPAVRLPCESDKPAADLDTSDGGDMLPYPNKFVSEKDQIKQREAREAAKKTALRPSKYASNFEQPSFGAPQ